MQKTKLTLTDVCNIEKLKKLLSDWSSATNMFVILTDEKGEHIAETGCTPDGNNAGSADFSLPITLPNGAVIGEVFAGQAPDGSAERRRKKSETESAYALLESILSSFTEKSYRIYSTKSQLDTAVQYAENAVRSDIENTLEGAGIGMWTMIIPNVGEPVLYADKTMNELLAASVDDTPECRFKKWIAGIDKSSIPLTDAYMETIKKEGRAEVLYLWNHPLRGQIWIRCGGVTDKSFKDGLKVNGYHQDVTEVHNTAEEHRRRLREQYSVIGAISSIYRVVWVFDVDANRMQVIREDDGLLSPAQNAGFDSAKAIENVIENCVAEDDRAEMRKFYDLRRLAKALETAESESKEFRDTILGWCRITAIPVSSDKNGRITQLLIGVQKIDEEKKRELRSQQMLTEAYVEAKRANTAKTEFLSRMSHDIRTPMNGILGMAKIAEKCIDDKKRVLYALSKIDEAGKNLEMLINDVLDMSRLESGKTELTHEPFNIMETLRSDEAAIRIMREEKSVEFKGAHFNITHTDLIGSPLHIQRITTNIITNALKYNKPGGSIELWLDEIPVDSKHSNYRFIVKDTGIGMSEEFLRHIFEPFSREHIDAGTKYTGTGLGMAITKELVDLMGGTIRAESRLGEGSTFTVELPFELYSGSITADKTHNDVEISLKGMNILLAEDNMLNMEIAEFLLKDAGASVVTAYNGSEALDKYEKEPPFTFDVIMMDIMMPVMNGLDASRAIRTSDKSDAKTIPIIAMTANAFSEDVKKCKAAGMNEHIAKPLDIQKTLRTIAKYRK